MSKLKVYLIYFVVKNTIKVGVIMYIRKKKKRSNNIL